MACEQFASALSAHAAGGEPGAALRAHLGRCERCRQELARARELVARLDADLIGELRVAPSAGFEARVISRIAQDAEAGQRVGAGWLAGWRLALGAAALTVVALVAGVTVLKWGGAAPNVAGAPMANRVEAADAGKQVRAPQVATTTERPDRQGAERPPDVTAVRAVATAQPHRSPGGVAPRRQREPEVLVPPDQQIAIARLFDMIRRGTLDEKALQASEPSEPAAPPLVVEELKVSPIVVAPGGNEKHR